MHTRIEEGHMAEDIVPADRPEELQITVRSVDGPDNLAFRNTLLPRVAAAPLLTDLSIGPSVQAAVREHDVQEDAPAAKQTADVLAVTQQYRWGAIFEPESGIPSVDIDQTLAKDRLTWEDREALLDAVALRSALLEREHQQKSVRIRPKQDALTDMVDMLDAAYLDEGDEASRMVFGSGIDETSLNMEVAPLVERIAGNTRIARVLADEYGKNRSFSFYMHAGHFEDAHERFSNAGTQDERVETYHELHRAAQNMYMAARTMRMHMRMLEREPGALGQPSRRTAEGVLSEFITNMDVAMGISDSHVYASLPEPFELQKAYFRNGTHPVLESVTEFVFPGAYDVPADGEEYPFIVPSSVDERGTPNFLSPRSMLRMGLKKAHAQNTAELLSQPDGVVLSGVGLRRVLNDVRTMYGSKAYDALQGATTYGEIIAGLGSYIETAHVDGNVNSKDPYPHWSRAMGEILQGMNDSLVGLSPEDKKRVSRLVSGGGNGDLTTMALVSDVVAELGLAPDAPVEGTELSQIPVKVKYPSQKELRSKYAAIYEADKKAFDAVSDTLRVMAASADFRVEDDGIKGFGKTEREVINRVPQLSLLIGPTGSGKTNGFVRDLAAEFDIDIAVLPAAADVPDGYRGNKYEYDTYFALLQLKSAHPELSDDELREKLESRTVLMKDEALKYLEVPRESDKRGKEGFDSGRDLLQAKLQMLTGNATTLVQPMPPTDSTTHIDREILELCGKPIDFKNIPIMLATSLPQEFDWLVKARRAGQDELGSEYKDTMTDYDVLRALNERARREHRTPHEVGELLGLSPDLRGRIGNNVFILDGPGFDQFVESMESGDMRNGLNILTAELSDLIGVEGSFTINEASREALAQYLASLATQHPSQDGSWRELETSAISLGRTLKSWLIANHFGVIEHLQNNPGDQVEITYEMVLAAIKDADEAA